MPRNRIKYELPTLPAMRINSITWDALLPYLKKARRQSDSSLANHKSRFKTLQQWFKGKDFDQKNFSIFLDHVEKLGLSPSYQNNCLKLAKHLARYLGHKDEFDDFRYVNEGNHEPEFICTPDIIEKLANTTIKYQRFKNRKEKYFALIYFLGNVGSRIDETLHLEWKDLRVDAISMIHFRGEITKTKKERYCPIPKWLCQIILELPRENQFIFSKIDASNFRIDLAKRSEICRLHYKVKPHTLRDSSINNKLAYGMKLEQVANYHGHAKIDTTYRFYVRIQAKELAQSLTSLDPAFRDDQNYDICIDATKSSIEKIVNPRVCNYMYEYITNEQNKRVVVIRLTEK